MTVFGAIEGRGTEDKESANQSYWGRVFASSRFGAWEDSSILSEGGERAAKAELR